jgi:hypothetical protein
MINVKHLHNKDMMKKQTRIRIEKNKMLVAIIFIFLT